MQKRWQGRSTRDISIYENIYPLAYIRIGLLGESLMKNKPLNSRLIEDKEPQFDDMVFDLASSLTKGNKEVKDNFGEHAPSP